MGLNERTHTHTATLSHDCTLAVSFLPTQGRSVPENRRYSHQARIVAVRKLTGAEVMSKAIAMLAMLYVGV